MTRTLAIDGSLTKLLDQSSRPIYAVDARRTLVYCNEALAAWLGLETARIVGRRVEYYSAPDDEPSHGDAAPLADLCPPPRALAGEACVGAISCVARQGRLVHRQADFIPLGRAAERKIKDSSEEQQQAVLVMLASQDMSHQELASELSAEPSADELHRAIRRFRREQANRYAIESLLGNSSAMRKVRAQVAAAAATAANTLVCGRDGSGRGHVARAIHYRAAGDAPSKLVPIDCELLTDDMLRRALDALRFASGDARQRPTLLLENLEGIQASHQSHLLACIQQNAVPARIIATCSTHTPCAVAETATDADLGEESDDASARNEPTAIHQALLDALSTITIQLPRLADRLEDLPILAQCFLEACNQGSGKQVGSLRSDAIDLLMLYSWPGELDQLKEVIESAHGACASHQILPADLPPVIHHASKAATHVRREPERVVLDELLAAIEKEAIVRALAQSRGNKSEAADLLGMTRPRFYRRLVQLGLAEAPTEPRTEQPEFIEREPEHEP